MPSRASRAKFNDTQVLQILEDYVSRNITASVNLDIPSKETRRQICQDTGLKENQLMQWFSRAKRKCGPEIMMKFAITRIFAKGGEYCSAGPIRGTKALVAVKPAKQERIMPGRTQPMRTVRLQPVRAVRDIPLSQNRYPKRAVTSQEVTSSLNCKPSYVKKLEPFDEVQLATLEQSWIKGLLQNPMNYIPISDITGITADSVKD
jgi:hypothetical protein